MTPEVTDKEEELNSTMTHSADPATNFMRDLDARFQRASGLSDRRDYSIFYSRVVPSRVMVIGIKPGGRRDGSHQLASQTFYEDNAHEYVDMDYRIASVMRPALMKALGATDAEQLRAVPKTNCFFQRAVGTDDFTSAELQSHAKLCAPFLTEMITAVGPDVLILEGTGARDLLVRHHCQSVSEDLGERVVGMRRGRLSTFFKRETAWLSSLGREVTLLTLGHPSHFGHLPMWEEAIDALGRNLGPDFLQASTDPSAARPIPPSINPPASNAALETKLAVRRAPVAGREARPVNDGRLFAAAKRPPESFRYSPIHDFWNEMLKTGPISVDAFYTHLMTVGWRRPSGKPLTQKIVRIDLVSMVKNGFASVSGER